VCDQVRREPGGVHGACGRHGSAIPNRADDAARKPILATAGGCGGGAGQPDSRTTLVAVRRPPHPPPVACSSRLGTAACAPSRHAVVVRPDQLSWFALDPIHTFLKKASASRGLFSSPGLRLTGAHTVAPIRCVFLCPPLNRRAGWGHNTPQSPGAEARRAAEPTHQLSAAQTPSNRTDPASATTAALRSAACSDPPTTLRCSTACCYP
jgi:hypothetical protein